MHVPFLDLQAQYQALKTDIDPAIEEVLRNSTYIQGVAVTSFEREFADFLDANHAIGVGNGTDALYLSLKASGIGPGDEVITVANTFLATTEAISATGASIVLVDADPVSYTINPSLIERAITPRTRAIIPVHLFGQPADMAPIMEIARRHGLRVIEDACQAHGAWYDGKRVGTIGDIGCFSCYPGKNLGAYGDAGIIVTNDDDTAERLRLLGSHGSKTKYVHEIEGWNSRLDSIQAAVLSVKLSSLDSWNELRNEHARRYQRLLSGLPLTEPRIVNHSHVWHLFVVESENRDGMARYLAERGVATGIHYPLPIHLLPAYRHLSYETGAFPVSERAASRILSLPMFPELTIAQIDYVVESIAQFAQESDHELAPAAIA